MSKYFPEFFKLDRQDLITVFPTEYRQMVAEKAKSPEELADHLRPHPIELHQLHMAFAKLGEAVELETAFDIFEFTKDPADGLDILKELGDCTFYICGATGGIVPFGSGMEAASYLIEPTEITMSLWPRKLPLPERLITDDWQSQVKLFRWVAAQWHDAYKRLLIYRTGDPQVSDVSERDAAKRARLEVVVAATSIIMVMMISRLALFVDPSVSFQDILRMNMEKLGVRYAGRYSNDDANARKDVAAHEDDCTAMDPAARSN